MKNSVWLLIIVIIPFSIGCNTTPQNKPQYNNEQFNLELAYKWAPIHYQDTDDSNYKADYITKFNYDNNFIGNDNSEHIATGNLSAYVYYSVVETTTHWFITYMFYHPIDWFDGTGIIDGGHENDAEGILEVIKKDNTTYGTFQCAITAAHSYLYSFVPLISEVTRNTNINREDCIFEAAPLYEQFGGTILMIDYNGGKHPLTAAEPKGHGFVAFPYGDFNGIRPQDGIIYFPSESTSEIPYSASDYFVTYQLINLIPNNNLEESLWNLQIFQANNTPGFTFGKWGSFAGNRIRYGNKNEPNTMIPDYSASAPWGWDNSFDGNNHRGTLALDPATLVNNYFNNLGEFSLIYSKNKYLFDLKLHNYSNSNLPEGWPPSLDLNEMYSRLDLDITALPGNETLETESN